MEKSSFTLKNSSAAMKISSIIMKISKIAMKISNIIMKTGSIIMKISISSIIMNPYLKYQFQGYRCVPVVASKHSSARAMQFSRRAYRDLLTKGT